MGSLKFNVGVCKVAKHKIPSRFFFIPSGSGILSYKRRCWTLQASEAHFWSCGTLSWLISKLSRVSDWRVHPHHLISTGLTSRIIILSRNEKENKHNRKIDNDPSSFGKEIMKTVDLTNEPIKKLISYPASYLITNKSREQPSFHLWFRR